MNLPWKIFSVECNTLNHLVCDIGNVDIGVVTLYQVFENCIDIWSFRVHTIIMLNLFATLGGRKLSLCWQCIANVAQLSLRGPVILTNVHCLLLMFILLRPLISGALFCLLMNISPQLRQQITITLEHWSCVTKPCPLALMPLHFYFHWRLSLLQKYKARINVPRPCQAYYSLWFIYFNFLSLHNLVLSDYHLTSIIPTSLPLLWELTMHQESSIPSLPITMCTM